MEHRRLFCFLLPLFLFLVPLSAFASSDPTSAWLEKSRELKLSEDPYWHTLLHYRSRFLRSDKSEIDASEFFNSEDGRTDPKAELEATIRAFFAPIAKDSKEQPAQCRFIDRFNWLREKLGSVASGIADPVCPEYQEWRKALDPESATVVFSSYYMNNPSSMFGHTLLRLNHRSHTSQDRLLDYGVNYAAIPTTSNAFLYGMMGLMGGFKGNFSNIPYYLKVQEYNDLESRDLWEYDLDLTPKQLSRLMDHLWAVGKVPVSYYFLDKNCSYMLLTLLDAAEPSLALSEEFQGAWVIPSDTVREVASRPGLVKRVLLRPSLSARIREQRAALNADQRKLFMELISMKDADRRNAMIAELKAGPSENGARVLDLVLDYLRLMKGRQKSVLTPDQSLFQKQVLAARVSIDRTPAEIEISAERTESLRPDLGHRTARFGGGSGYSSERGAFVELGVRAAFHDLIASPRGYPPYSQIELLEAQLRFYARDAKVGLEKANLVNILSLTPVDPLFSRMSWSARLGADPVRDFESGDAIEYKGQIGGGVSVKAADPLLFYALARMDLGASGAYAPHYRLGPTAVMGALFMPEDRWGFELWSSYSKPFLGYTPGYYQGSAQLRLSSSTNTELRLQYDLTRVAHQGKVVFNVYF